MKVIFLDRDGTLILEPPETLQVNSLQELEILPFAISSLQQLCKAGYKVILVTNQDGLGTSSNPLENYNNINNKIIQILKNEGIEFFKVFTCPHFSEDNCECRKPKTGLVQQFLREHNIDYEKSYMIGDRDTDREFAQNIGIKSFLFSHSKTESPVEYESQTQNWKSITASILNNPRTAQIHRKTKETDIFISLNLDGSGNYTIDTGIKFFDHMLEQLGKHGNFDIVIRCTGDLEIDEHHTIEDTALALGECFSKAIAEKRGIERYAHESFEKILPMDESLGHCSLDFSGRGEFIFNTSPMREMVGDFPTEMLPHFYKSFCAKAGINLNIKLEGENTHHLVEISFKSFARCLKESVRISGEEISSTKGVL